MMTNSATPARRKARGASPKIVDDLADLTNHGRHRWPELESSFRHNALFISRTTHKAFEEARGLHSIDAFVECSQELPQLKGPGRGATVASTRHLH
jgi:hypothetical protein